MIVFGTRNRKKSLSMGTFHCPRCNAQRPYERVQYKQWFTLYFIPIFPLREIGEFVECSTCHTAFELAVLNYKPKPQVRDLKMQLNQLKATLEQGAPIEYVVRDLTAAGLEREMALGAVKSAIGDARNICPDCELTYAAGVATCRECGAKLKPKP